MHQRRHWAPVGRGVCPRRTFSFALQVEDETQVSRATQGEQDNYEMHVRAANIVSHQVEGTVQAPEACGLLGFPGAEGQASLREEGFPRQLREGLAGSGCGHSVQCWAGLQRGQPFLSEDSL